MLKIFSKMMYSLLGIEHSPQLPAVIKNISWMFLDNVIRFFVGLVVLGMMAHYLGAGGFGSLSYALAFVSIFSLFASLGLNEYVLRRLAVDPLRKEKILSTAFVMKLLGGFLSFFICLILINFINPAAQLKAMVIIVAGSLVFQSFDIVDLYFQSTVQSRFSIIAKTTVFIVMSVVRVCLITMHASLEMFAWVSLIEMLLTGVALVIVFALKGNCLKFNILDGGIAVELFKNSWPLFLSGILVMVNMRIDQVLLEYFKGTHEVGIYAAAVRVSEIGYLLGSIIITSAFPIVFKLRHSNEDIFFLKLKQLYKVLLLIAGLVTIMVVVFSGQIIHLFFGVGFEQASPVLLVHIFSIPIVFMGGATTYALVACDLQLFHLARTFLGCLTNVVLNLMLIPKYGAMGAAYAMLISYLVAVFSIIFLKPVQKIFFIR